MRKYLNEMLTLFMVLCLSASMNAQQNSYGGEIVSNQKFGEGIMVTRAKIVPISGTVNNFFFYNRSDEPWNGNVWYEYDWEIRGKYPNNGWSQIRVREQNGGQLEDAPVNISATTNLGNEFLHYILIRKDDQYVYDIRRDFNINSYNYNNSSSHNGNSASLISGGPRVYTTGGNVGDIPSWKQLDFSLGITAFDNGWAGSLPNGDYTDEFEVDFTRFYTYSGNNVNINPMWSDEFNGSSLDYGKWYPANWTYSVTQFRQENIRLQNGILYLKINPIDSDGNNGGNNPSTNLALNGSASQSSTSHGGVPSRAIDGNTNGSWNAGSTTHTNNQNNAWWQVQLANNSNIEQIVIHNRTNNCCVNRLSNYTVSVLNENGNTVWSRFYSSAPNSFNTINLDASGRTVKVSLNGTLSLAEVEVFGTTTGNNTPIVSNIAPAGNASQSSTGYGGAPARAIDGNTNGKWSNGSVTHTQNQNSPWWQVNLAQNSTIEEIILFNRTDNCCKSRLSNYTVSILNNNGNTVFSRYFSDYPNPSNSIDVGSVEGRTVKVQLNGTNPLSLAEVQVMGYSNNQGLVQAFSFAHFDAIKQGEHVALHWLMDQSLSVIQYEIEYKNEAETFEQIAAVAGTSAQNFGTHQYIHEHPVEGENTYRIKVIYEDYSIAYLEPQTVRYDIENVSVYPNPTNGLLFLNLTEYSDREVFISISDLSGKEQLSYQFDRSHNSIEELDLSEFRNGLYLLYIKADGKKAVTEKISLMRDY